MTTDHVARRRSLGRIAFACLLASIALLASGCFYGLAYGPFRDGQSPSGMQPTRSEIREDLVQLRPVNNRIRTYGSSGVGRDVASEAAALGFLVTAGVSLDPDKAEAELSAAVDLANKGLAQSIVVGNEMLLTRRLNESDLVAYIRRVKTAVPNSVTVTTGEPWTVWLERPGLVNEVDYLLVHIYPSWEGQSIDGAAQYVVDKYMAVRNIANGKPVIIGETGWPSAGRPDANEANQRRFIVEFGALANQYGIPYFLFSAYDEEWKWPEGLPDNDPTAYLDRTFAGRFVGSSWGIFRANGVIKPLLFPLFPRPGLPPASRLTRTVSDSRGLADFYDIGVDSSNSRQDWLETTSDGMSMTYPAGQAWGAVFVTVGPPVDPPRPWKDFSSFRTLSVELRGETGGESVEIGIKDATDPDDGTEAKALVSNLSTAWQTYQFPLSMFGTADLTHLYVAVEFVFDGSTAETVYFRDVKFLP
jgi:exo-beta-1,3-glucanase (GH17 family)